MINLLLLSLESPISTSFIFLKHVYGDLNQIIWELPVAPGESTYLCLHLETLQLARPTPLCLKSQAHVNSGLSYQVSVLSLLQGPTQSPQKNKAFFSLSLDFFSALFVLPTRCLITYCAKCFLY